MRLHEEYLNRHKIHDIPIVNHCTEGAVILQTIDPELWQNRWVLVTIKWVEHPQHPGSYNIEFCVPVHNGESKGKLFSRLPTAEKEWDEYEEFILDWASNLKGVKPVVGHRQIVLAAWEMFVYCYDGWFRQQGSELKELLFKSLDEDFSIDARYVGYQQVLMHLSSHHPSVLKAWKYEVLSQVQCYADWLVKLLERRCDTPRSK
jgi:hypothetical protein